MFGPMPNPPPLVPVVLAGGSGARLWPLSRPEMPKQFVLTSGRGYSLFQETILRVANRALFAPALVITNRSYEALVKQNLEAIAVGDAAMIYEPYARNTAPAIALAALHLVTQQPDALMLVLPSDHHIAAPEILVARVRDAMPAAQAGYIVTFSVPITTAETGYGYIETGASLAQFAPMNTIAAFIEKPDANCATSLMHHGGYGWNSGIFLMRARTVLEEFALHASALMAICGEAYQRAQIEDSAISIHAEKFASCPSIAFDRAVMERTTRGVVTSVSMGWRDLGSWAALEAQGDL